jgi:hypothetical protein
MERKEGGGGGRGEWAAPSVVRGGKGWRQKESVGHAGFYLLLLCCWRLNFSVGEMGILVLWMMQTQRCLSRFALRCCSRS